MSTLGWIIAGGVLMSVIAMVGSVTLLLRPETLDRLLLPLVAFAAGSMIGGAFFHMIPAAIDEGSGILSVGIAVVAGFSTFFLLEQILHWHHCHRAKSDCKQPLTYLVLIGDGLHNFLGGLSIAGTFLIDIRLGITRSGAGGQQTFGPQLKCGAFAGFCTGPGVIAGGQSIA